LKTGFLTLPSNCASAGSISFGEHPVMVIIMPMKKRATARRACLLILLEAEAWS